MSVRITGKAKSRGASLAGIASIAPLESSPSYMIYDRAAYYEGYEKLCSLHWSSRCLCRPWFVDRLNLKLITWTMNRDDPLATANWQVQRRASNSG